MKIQLGNLHPGSMKALVLGILFVASFLTAWLLVSDPDSDNRVPTPPLPKPIPAVSPQPGASHSSASLVIKASRVQTGTPSFGEANSLLQSGDAAKALLAIDLSEGLSESETWSVLRTAIRSESPQVRAAVVERAAEMDVSPELSELLKNAVSDKDPFVGFTVLEVTENLPKAERNEIFQRALESALPEIGATVVGDLEIQGDHSAIEILVRGLDSIAAETREETQMTLELMFDKNFANATEATAWWQSNQVRYDKDLILKD